jgi:RNA polymerase sigma-70 factor, ECF subfamily
LNPSSKQIVHISDDQIFESLFRTHYDELVHFALSYISNEDDAEEIVQQLFVTLWSQTTIEINTSVKSYLMGSVRNRCLNHLRHEKVKASHATHHQITHPNASNIDFLELEELKEAIEAALNKLPAKCRQIFNLSRYEGKKYQEIADHLHLSIKTVENQMSKALKLLRNELKDFLILIFLWMVNGGRF